LLSNSTCRYILVSIYNLHRSPVNWGPSSQEFEPMRFGPLSAGQPSELNTGYRYTPFSAGRVGTLHVILQSRQK
jgi:hypothetical protein